MRILRQLTIVCVSVLALALGACDDDDDEIEGQPIVPGGGAFGARCTLDTDCATGVCLVNDRFPAGFCTQRCSVDAAACIVGSQCFDLGGVDGQVCLGPCASDLDCDDIGVDLTCSPFEGTQFCDNALLFF